MQPESSVAAAKTSPIDKNFIMQIPQAKASLRMLPTVSRNDDREKCFGAAAQPNQFHAFGRRFKPASTSRRMASDLEGRSC